MTWVLLAVLALVLWYVIAPAITPRALRPRNRAGQPPDTDNETDAQGRRRR